MSKTLLMTCPTRKLLSLQTQLYTVEQLATVAITNEIKRNPPKCLMAMIGPSVGSGSSGGKENCHNDDIGEDDKTKKQNEEKKNMSSSEQQEVQLRGTSIEAKYNKPIDRGQVQHVHRHGTSTEVKFIKFIEKIDNSIAKKNAITTT